MVNRSAKYPWHEWMDGETHDIQEGRDYECSTGQMRQYLYRKAYDKGLKVRVNTLHDPEGLDFTFLDREGKPLTKTPDPQVQPRRPVEDDGPIDDRSYISDEALAALISPRTVVDE